MSKRPRPNSVDRLPAEADDIRTWAVNAIIARRLTKLEIFQTLNARLAELNIPAISHSAFSRWALAGLDEGFAPRVPSRPGSATCPACGAPIDTYRSGGRA